MKIQNIAILLFLLIFSSYTSAQTQNGFVQKDHTHLVQYVASRTDSSQHSMCDFHQWEAYMNRVHPSVKTMEQYFYNASEEFVVPMALLKVIAQVESNWTQIGPSIDRGWGVMHLVDNSYSQTLIKASRILDLDPQILKDNAEQNIRGMSALLRSEANKSQKQPSELSDWFPFVKKCTGLFNEDLEELQTKRYYDLLNKGMQSLSAWGEIIKIEAIPVDISGYLNENNPLIFSEKAEKSLDYPPAISNLTDCNFAEGRNHEIDAWVNHWIGTGTYAGAISWFHNCDAEVSAHFVIRSSDGEITQVVGVENTAWHCGASGYPYNNSRSIGVEHEATLSNPGQWNSMPMLEASATMAAYFCDEYGIPKTLSLPGIRGHNQMPGTNTMCPGNLPWFTWMSLLDENFAEPDLVIMDMWTNPEFPEEGLATELFVKIKNVGNADADSVFLNFRVNNEIVGFDSLFLLEADSNHICSFPNYIFQNTGINDYCVYIDAVENESNTMNNSYCIDIDVQPAFGISENYEMHKLKVYPNPSTTYLNIEWEEESIEKVEVFNLSGSLIQTYSDVSENRINIQSLAKGSYLLRVLNEAGVSNHIHFIKY